MTMSSWVWELEKKKQRAKNFQGILGCDGIT